VAQHALPLVYQARKNMEQTSTGTTSRRLAWAATWVAVAAVAACGGGGDGGTAATGDGTLRVALTDAPSCGYDHVWVTVDRVRVHQSSTASDADGGWREVVLSPARRIDLLTLTNGVLEELGQTQLPAGSYSQVRLVLADTGTGAPPANAVQPTGGAVTALSTPSGQQSGLKLQAHFDVQAGQTADLVLDFDACQSVVKAGNSGRYNLKPVLAVTPRISTSIEGYVTTTLTLSGTTVTAQQNGTVVRATTPDSSGRFVLPFLVAGNYDVVVVSEGRATSVVASVPVTATATRTLVSGTATAIAPPASTMRDVSGTASVATTGTATAVLVTDATIRAMQALTGGPAITVAATTSNAETAAYALRLPAAAPMKAAYSSTAAPVFAADSGAAGKYSIVATAPGRTALQQAIDVATAGLTLNLSFAP
jgi:hypothetical protein